jgi:hypothetical protein
MLTIAAAFVLSWQLFNYGGYFLGIFAALGGVVLGALVEASWDSLSEQWHDWSGEFRRRLKQRSRGEVARS